MSVCVPSATEIIDAQLSRPPADRSYLRRIVWHRTLSVIGLWIERSRQRHALADLDDRLLKDVGIIRSAAADEIAKPFWR